MKISKMLGKRLSQFTIEPDYSRPHHQTSVGIEVEVEGVDATDEDFKRWTVTNDGSLQGGIELVSLPVWGSGISDALMELDNFFKRSPPYLSFRTSVHVHVNMLDLDTRTVIYLLNLYLFYEKPLFRLHQKWNRYDNMFCVPVRKSIDIQSAYSALIKDLERGRVKGSYVGHKYSALNPNSLSKFGTLEFRHMGGCSDVKEISNWINILLQLKVAAILREPFTDVNEVFGEYASMLKVTDKDLEEGRKMLNYINLKRTV